MKKFLFFLLIPFIFTVCKSQPPVEPEVIEIAEEPVIQTTEPVIEIIEPEFNVVSIVIIQADLINTQFEAVVRIDNPNQFTLNLSSLDFELYGNGAFWASGRGKDILHIPANSFRETEFRFTMNFIDMSRYLLDEIISMRQINYRFKGDVEVEPGIQKISPFHMTFECSGFSAVKKKAE